jgi:hypothetical protein
VCILNSETTHLPFEINFIKIGSRGRKIFFMGHIDHYEKVRIR